MAAVINWYGITDVGELLEGPNMRSYAVEWMGSMPNRFEIASRVSPLTYVRAGLPAILTITGMRIPSCLTSRPCGFTKPSTGLVSPISCIPFRAECTAASIESRR